MGGKAFIPGRCSVPACTFEPPKDANPFCQGHWQRLSGHWRRRLAVVFQSRTGNHHGKVAKLTEASEWQSTVADAVRSLGAVPHHETPQAVAPPAPARPMAAATQRILSVLDDGDGEASDETVRVHRELAAMSATPPESEAPQPPVPAAEPRRPVRHRVQVAHEGVPTAEVREAFKDWMLERYLAGLPLPSQEEVYLAGIKEGVRRTRDATRLDEAAG